MMTKKLVKLVREGVIKKFEIVKLNDEGKPFVLGTDKDNRTTEQLKIVFNNDDVLTIDTFCNGSLENTVIFVS